MGLQLFLDALKAAGDRAQGFAQRGFGVRCGLADDAVGNIVQGCGYFG